MEPAQLTNHTRRRVPLPLVVVDRRRAAVGRAEARLMNGWSRWVGSSTTPFVLAGESTVDNLRAVSDVSAMRFYGGLVSATVGVADGQTVVINLDRLSRVLDPT
jgi:hypothetical protein